jgi:hypothetical protein
MSGSIFQHFFGSIHASNSDTNSSVSVSVDADLPFMCSSAVQLLQRSSQVAGQAAVLGTTNSPADLRK